jgi:hypothetical protein
MLIQYKRGYTPTAEDLGLQGVDFRQGVTDGMSVDTEADTGNLQTEWLRRLGLRVSRSNQLVGMTTTPSPELIFNLLERRGPFILRHHCGAFWYGPGVTVPTSGGHAVLVTGIDTERGGCWFNNPWGRTDVMTTTRSLVGAIQRWENASSANKPFAYMS